MSAQTLADLSRPLTLLRLIVSEHPGLAAPTVAVSPLYPERLTLSFHDDFPGFEAWRQALKIAPEDVSYRVQGGRRTGVLDVHAAYGGADIRLIGFADLPAAGEPREGEEATP
ncbi:hypothetical protein AB0N93_06940 [Streptomyces sp. NPDC091267]|uniref:hypothetical protein n=1 Tax=Streptomyces sp. NPDC091267 TaxID=3155195 RepID=UPI00343F36E9